MRKLYNFNDVMPCLPQVRSHPLKGQRLSPKEIAAVLANASSGVRASTWKQYGQAAHRFNKIVSAYGFPKYRLSFSALVVFMVHCAKVNKTQGATIRSYLSALRRVAEVLEWSGFSTIVSSTPEGKRLDRLGKHLVELRPAKRARQPIRGYELSRLFTTMRVADRSGTRYARLAFGLLYHGALRINEAAKLKKCDVTFIRADGEYKGARLNLRDVTKNGQPGVDASVFIVDRDSEIDILGLLVSRCASITDDDYVIPLHRFARPGTYPKGEASITDATRPELASKLVAELLRKWLRRAGLISTAAEEKRYVPHSFRHGMATDMFDNDLPVEWVMKHGRWRSNAVQQYNHTTHRILDILGGVKIISAPVIS